MNILSFLPIIKNVIFGNKYVTFGLSIILILSSFYFFYFYTNKKIKNLEVENVNLQKEIVSVNEDMRFLVSKLDQAYQIRIDLVKKLEVGMIEKRKLEESLNRGGKKKTISEIANKKRLLVQNKINNASGEMVKCFEKLSKGDDKC